MTTALITTCDLKKHYNLGGIIVRALDGLTINIPRNTFTVVMGPSGSGKSTLLYLLGGLDRPTEGQIDYQGSRLDEMDENRLALFRRQVVGFVFQSFNLIQSMTALDNVGFPMQFSSVSGKERHRRAKDLLSKVGLEDRADHKPGELSGGQQQRVAIARALVNDPEFILADEPTGNLDSSSGLSIMQLLSDIHKSGRTVLVVSHDIRIMHYSTHVIYLLDGREVSQKQFQQGSLV